MTEQRRRAARGLEVGAYEAIFVYSLDGVMLTVPDGRVIAANPASCQMLGRSEEDICRLGRQGIADPTDLRWLDAVAERARTRRARSQVRFVRGDGSTFEADLSSATFRTSEGEPRSCVIFRDLSDRLVAAQQVALFEDHDRTARHLHDTVIRRVSAASSQLAALLSEEADRPLGEQLGRIADELDETVANVREAVFRLGSETERRYQSLVENSPVALAVFRGSDARFVYANRRAVELYGADDLDDMLSRHVYEVIPEDLRPGWRQRVGAILNESRVIRQGRNRIVRFDGRELTVEVNATRIDFDGEACVQIELQDVTRRSEIERRRQERLQREVRTDPLTGLLNRRGWTAALNEGLAGAQTTRSPFTVAMVDLDHFKVFNDSYGHPAGDKVLRDLAVTWQAELRSDDAFARIGGEEFSLALPETDLRLAQTLLHRLSERVPQGQTISAGLAEWDGHETGEELVVRADRALYEAKRTGRARTALAQPSPHRVGEPPAPPGVTSPVS